MPGVVDGVRTLGIPETGTDDSGIIRSEDSRLLTTQAGQCQQPNRHC